MAQEAELQFVSFPIEKIFPDRPLPGDLYLFLNGHFIKYKNKEDDISQDKYELFVYQKVQYLFLKAQDLDAYSKWSNQEKSQIKTALVEAIGKENEDVVDAHLTVKDEYFSFLSKEVTEDSVKEMLDKTRSFINVLKDKKSADKFTAKLLSYNQNVADHSTNVANLSVFLAMNAGYNQQIILENIYIGALLHDYGKVKIDPKYLEDPKSKKYESAMRKHPELGRTALLLDSGFSEEALRIVAEHHERNDGTGFPKGLKGARIYELTKIVSIANIFDNLVMKGEGEPRARQIKAYRSIEKDPGKMFDPKVLGKCLRILERVIF